MIDMSAGINVRVSATVRGVLLRTYPVGKDISGLSRAGTDLRLVMGDRNARTVQTPATDDHSLLASSSNPSTPSSGPTGSPSLRMTARVSNVIHTNC